MSYFNGFMLGFRARALEYGLILGVIAMSAIIAVATVGPAPTRFAANGTVQTA